MPSSERAPWLSSAYGLWTLRTFCVPSSRVTTRLHYLPELGVVVASTVLALDEDAFALLVREVVGDHRVGAAGLADLVVVVAERLGAH